MTRTTSNSSLTPHVQTPKRVHAQRPATRDERRRGWFFEHARTVCHEANWQRGASVERDRDAPTVERHLGLLDLWFAAGSGCWDGDVGHRMRGAQAEGD